MADYEELVRQAGEARANAYAPYSRFTVGAAALAASGKVYTGCNVENRSYGLTICAERVALCKAVAAGERRFVAVAVVTEGPELATPCGACRQSLAEFGLETVIIAATTDGQRAVFTVGQLLPRPFAPPDVCEPRGE